jgi:hypothetical protein
VAWVKEQHSILRDDEIEKIDPGNDANEIGQFSSGDKQKLSVGPPQDDEGVCGCAVDDAIMRKRAVIVGRQTADVHGRPRRSFTPILAERPKERPSSCFTAEPRSAARRSGTTRVLLRFTQAGDYSRPDARRAPERAEQDKWRSTGGYGRFWSTGAWRQLPRCFAKTVS